ncbi:MAG: translation initiation factor Sui1 [Thermodesulfobacteriota bacterium]|jgi:translation initiation factor 1|nr:MAG: translation initiation factor Sui1 [Thermodesulfobacteriota bacterium]
MKSNKSKNTEVVYSTEFGKGCPSCGKPIAQCVCHINKHGIPHDGIVRVGRETKGRKGSGMTVITGVPLDKQSLKQLAKQLKQKCGTGGTVKSGVIEIQGDQRNLLMKELSALGYTVKLSGG